jgi:hypothetical protein
LGTYYNPAVLVYDFLNEKKIFEGEIYPLSSFFKISPDGRYFHSKDQVFEIQAETILPVPVISNEIQNCSFFDFHMNDPESFVYVRDDHLYIKRISDLSTVSECFIPWMLYVFNIDYNANQVLVFKEEKFRIYDIVSGEEEGNYPASYWGISSVSVRYCNNTIYDSERGLRLKIK